MPAESLTLSATEPAQRLDKLLQAQLPGYSRGQVQALIRGGYVRVDGIARKSSYHMRGGEVVQVCLPPPADTALMPEPMPLDIVYEDAKLAVINKPAGLVVQPGPGHESGTLVHALLARYPELAQLQDEPELGRRLGLAHRLDRGTSGLIVAARDKATLEALMAQFKARSVHKRYLALLEHRPRRPSGIIDAPIARDPRRRQRYKVQRGGKPAQTEYELLDDDFQGGRALARLTLLTGRTHQIRVHMAFMACPVVGDTVYGYRKQRLRMKRLFLHAAELGFVHPLSGEWLHFEAALPAGLANVLAKLR